MVFFKLYEIHSNFDKLDICCISVSPETRASLYHLRDCLRGKFRFARWQDWRLGVVWCALYCRLTCTLYSLVIAQALHSHWSTYRNYDLVTYVYWSSKWKTIYTFLQFHMSASSEVSLHIVGNDYDNLLSIGNIYIQDGLIQRFTVFDAF